MTNEATYRFKPSKPQAPKLLAMLLDLAVKETEVVYGQARVKLETSFEVKDSECRIEGGTECAEHLAKLFTGFLIKKFGEQGFRVERLEKRR
ncbi:MAG: hypothetical protein HY077_03650 [Elusimicrobia bacterium]|nr:hypothetical protein [Elusimicrobiota bacterium]